MLLVFLICVVLPISIVWICVRASNRRFEQKMELLKQAISSGAPVDLDKLNLLVAKEPKKKRPLTGRLTWGLCLTLMGIGVIIFWLLLEEDPSGGVILTLGIIPLAIGIGLIVATFLSKRLFPNEIEKDDVQNE